VSIHLEGLEGLVEKITRLEQLEAVKAGIRAIAIYIKGKIAKYPASTIANNPGQKRWYERGWGTHWATRWGPHGYATSETLGRSWAVESTNSGFGAIVGNDASYGRKVQDADVQADFHAWRGWVTVQDVADEETEYVNDVLTEIVQEEIDK
jgi:hypothetical protein